jgi:DNA-binding transcriptional ArsR family regulator
VFDLIVISLFTRFFAYLNFHFLALCCFVTVPKFPLITIIAEKPQPPLNTFYLTVEFINTMVYYKTMDAFTAIGDPIRRHIIELLATQGSLTATEISSHFHVSPQAISKHLKVLRQADVLEVEKKAQQRIYSLNPETMIVVEEWARQYRLMWSERFKKLDRLLQARKEQLNTSKLERKDGQ